MSKGLRPIVATYHGIEVPDAPHFGPNMIKSMNEGRFEKHEVQVGLAMIKPGARILELGAGSGIVGAVLARNCEPEKMVSVEANPNLIEHIEHLHSHNGLSNTIDVVHGVVLSEPEPASQVDFFVKGNFLGSGLTVKKRPEKAQRISVPVIRYSDLRLAFPHDVIMMDIEGGERDFLRDADLNGVNTVILEVHRQIYGREGMQKYDSHLRARAWLSIKKCHCQESMYTPDRLRNLTCLERSDRRGRTRSGFRCPTKSCNRVAPEKVQGRDYY